MDQRQSSTLFVVEREGIFTDYAEHSSGKRTSTSLVFLQDLRKNHPNARVTCISATSCDLLGYASAGHAKATLELEGEPFQIERLYHAPSNRLSNELGSLAERIVFGHYAYACGGLSLLVYKLAYYEPPFGVQQEYYIISSKSAGDPNDHNSPEVDSFLLKVGKWTSEPHEQIYVFDGGLWGKSSELWKSVHSSSWDQVVLDEHMKKSVIEDVQGFFDGRELYRELAVPWKRGIIFHGIPGNGKTISIKALMSSLSSRPDPIPSLYVKSFESRLGLQFSIRSIFSQARTMAPCLLIFEDLDSLVTEKVRSYFLNEVDGIESNDGILMIGSTNHLERLDPAISKRPSRFDRKYHFKLPSEQERTAYCEFWRRKLERSSLVEFPQDASPIVARLTEGFSFAYLKELFITTLLIVARGGLGNEENEDKTKEARQEDGQLTNKRERPSVTVPAHLKDNKLLQLVPHQAKILLSEMDNTSTEKWRSTKP
jgi:transitional endoplasmic reticulum ATPase